jgi:hypothetical protein
VPLSPEPAPEPGIDLDDSDVCIMVDVRPSRSQFLQASQGWDSNIDGIWDPDSQA